MCVSGTSATSLPTYTVGMGSDRAKIRWCACQVGFLTRRTFREITVPMLRAQTIVNAMTKSRAAGCASRSSGTFDDLKEECKGSTAAMTRVSAESIRTAHPSGRA